MARQPYFVNTSQKQMDVEVAVGGGMVTQTHPEKIRDDQSILIENGDILAGSIIQSRGAYSQTNSPSPVLSGNTQGYFKYRTLNGNQEIVAVNGYLYTVVGNTYTQLPITGLPNGFQTTRPIEAVQYVNKLYIATGSAIVVYDGTTASTLTAYAPNGLEALYIGTNGYATNPDNYLTDMTGAADEILGVTTSSRYGITNQNVTFTAYIESISGDSLEYQWEVKQTVDADYPTTPAVAFGTGNKSWTTSFAIKSDYMLRCSIRKAGTTTILSQYVLPRYKVQTTPDENPEQGVNFSNLSTCNRILVHYDRLMIYGDTTNPQNLYISHLKNFAYFPRTNIIPVIDPLRGSLQKVAQYRTWLVFFTDGSLQMMTGTSPADYDRTNINMTIGTKDGYSVQVLQNYLIFVGSDYGIYRLAQIRSTSMMMNVTRIDMDIRDNIGSLVKTSTRLLSSVYNNQYYLYIENNGGNYIYRYYYDLNLWVRDSIEFTYSSMYCIDNVLTVTQSTGGTICKLLAGVFYDGVNTIFNLNVNSKDYDFGMPHHRKKLKQYQLLIKMAEVTQPIVSLYLDNILLSTTVLSYDITQTTDAQKLKIMASGRFRYCKVQLSIPVQELIQIIGFGFVYKLNTPK